MPRKKTSLWFKGLELLARASLAPPKKKTAARKPAARKAAAKAPSVRSPAASATGKWLRSYHSAPPLAGHLVNHLAYALYVPASLASQAGAPLVVMLHGCKQTAESFAAGTRICRLAERAGFAVLLPEQAKTAHAQRCWHWHGEVEHTEAPAVASLVEAMVAQHGFDASRVYLAGISAGAGLASVLAMRHAPLFAAVGLHSGPVFGAATSTMSAMHVMRRGTRDDPVQLVDEAVDVAAYPGMPAMIVHGEFDAVVDKRNATQLATEFARVNRLIDAQGELRVGETRSYRRDDTDYTDWLRAGRLVVRLCIVRGLGHAWSGGDAREAFHSGKGPEATSLLWQFFRRQQRAG
ncbi:extracellular catalytic domain type 1 short-chain-length polyhydroxyalkanoate depolymerase [Paraburkholderia acidisoli]|uniref:PHB depolymerase family esterase n=1 Tax=Paraburkholderia acidisoli TaxID=2571748 RepID=A0A7Z2GRE1_9BURK|nr:PHB depolymerase family esterase [Paraburkholderia acidisoli]QGZ66492.1 PHB depolymerase family esterase [Paraburkholderia acidisoli]